MIAYCPIPGHDDDTPSCSMREGRGGFAYHCFGCGAGGDIFDLVAALEGLDVRGAFPEVALRAAEIAGVSPELPRAPRHQPPRRPAPPPGPPPLADERFAAIVRPLLVLGGLDGSAYSADVESYLDGRGLLALARAEGWAALPRPEHQPAIVRMLRDAAEPLEGVERSFTEEDLERCGLLARDRRALLAPINRLIIPWRDPAGQITCIQRRRLDDQRDGKYVFPSGRKPAHLYGVDRARELPADAPVEIVEGAIDVIALRALLAAIGERALVIGIPGVDGWRGVDLSIVRGRVVRIALDADTAGERAVMALAEACVAAGAVRPERHDPPDGLKDWAETWTRLAGGEERRAA